MRCCAIIFILLACLGGCITKPANPAATQPATAIDPAQAEASFWLEKPPVVTVRSPDFQRLWDAAEKTMRNRGFVPDRVDYRSGTLTSQPRVSRQFFEFWRSDPAGEHATNQSSLGTIRRTIHLQIARSEEGAFELAPKVLVERQVSPGRRVTAVTEVRSALAPSPTVADDGKKLPARYWYALGRDEDMERSLAESIQRRVQ